jgi:hypothetical protein
MAPMTRIPEHPYLLQNDWPKRFAPLDADDEGGP